MIDELMRDVLWSKPFISLFHWRTVKSMVRLRASNSSSFSINYQHALSSALYRFIKEANPDLSSELHHSETFKFFNFSYLQVPRAGVKGDRIELRQGTHASFLFSSPDSRILESTISGMLATGELEILGQKFDIEGIEIMKTPEFGRTVRFRSLSPIYIDDGNSPRRDLMATDEGWRERLVENTGKKYSMYKGKETKIDFKIGGILSFRSKRINIAGNWWRASMAVFDAEGEPEVLRFLWDTGIGSRNSQGMGALRVERN